MIYQENLGDKQSLVSTIFIIYIFLGIIKKNEMGSIIIKVREGMEESFSGIQGLFLAHKN